MSALQFLLEEHILEDDRNYKCSKHCIVQRISSGVPMSLLLQYLRENIRFSVLMFSLREHLVLTRLTYHWGWTVRHQDTYVMPFYLKSVY